MTDPGERAFLDQLDAASAALDEADRFGYQLGRAIGWFISEGVQPRPEDMPEWVHRGCCGAFDQWLDGKASTCIHAPVYSKPQPVWACAWKPGMVVCEQCLLLFNVATLAEDRTCDGCGRVVGGPENGDPMYSGGVGIDNFMFKVGMCGDCLPEQLR
jgi:hypothetical protein